VTSIVAVLGALIVLVGLVGLVQPGRFRSLLTSTDAQTRFVFAIALRVGMGALLWWLADDLRHPQVMRILAVIAFAAAVALLIMGRERLDSLLGWLLAKPDGVLRFSAACAGAFGAYLVYVAV